ncbi:hypothetical protein Mapa_006776 [Marchantia paleacea]|nr:hypothetical protein Mapa_006776 [Marchantia paleacea]
MADPRIIACLIGLLVLSQFSIFYMAQALPLSGNGRWKILCNNAGIPSMHSAVTRFNTIILIDRTNIGPSQIALPDGNCRDNPRDQNLTHDCTAHSVVFDPSTNSVRPVSIFSDTQCSTAQFLANGTLLHAGGDSDGLKKVRIFKPCLASDICDWTESKDMSLLNNRWYGTSQLLPDDRVIVIGGRGAFTYEFLPRKPSEGTYYMPFLNQTSNWEEDNLYPYVHLLPDGNLFIFANRDSILLDYTNNSVIRTYPTIPGEPRNYPSGGSSVMLPLDAANNYSSVEVLVCGGARLGSYRNAAKQWGCSKTCGRMTVTSTTPSWAMETMPFRRCMGDMILLPTADVLIINGAQNGSQGWDGSSNPAFSPVAYFPDNAPGTRFTSYAPTTIPRVYHATANLLPDGRILLAGSNPHGYYVYSNNDFPTELRIESFSPPYLQGEYTSQQPRLLSYPHRVTYGQMFNVTILLNADPENVPRVDMNLLSTPFVSHSYGQGQRLLKLAVTAPDNSNGVDNQYTMAVTAPPSATIAPRSYYMLFANNNGVPSRAVWVQIV